MALSSWANEWELVTEEGGLLVYKRPKRSRIDSQITASLHDGGSPDKILQARKRAALLNLKHKYEAEIQLWENLWNTLKATLDKPYPQLSALSSNHVGGAPTPPAHSEDNSSHPYIDEFLSQAEIQGAMIADISKLCDAAVAWCSAEEERVKKPFMDLPIWEPSPHKLIYSLCQE
ncbi:unnamed protein product [Cuscuta europaea]|uniref:Uncharacterized protein n=1 Tax=Cuscuta europaea TaxID=41803 RepID=A0A9P0ZU83_CUSEU|nr:unnamed protein product [Cuscuta europaea]